MSALTRTSPRNRQTPVEASANTVRPRRRYHSIRIDTVHYCQREAILAEKRKRRTFFDRNGEPEDPTQARLHLLCRTLRDDPARLGPLVEFLKIPYMLRESSQADLARTIAVLPSLKYVDLPEGMFQDDPPFITLRLEVQARCHELRRMTYMGIRAEPTGSGERQRMASAGGPGADARRHRSCHTGDTYLAPSRTCEPLRSLIQAASRMRSSHGMRCSQNSLRWRSLSSPTLRGSATLA